MCVCTLQYIIIYNTHVWQVVNQCLDVTGPDGKPVGILPVELFRFEPGRLQGYLADKKSPPT